MATNTRNWSRENLAWLGGLVEGEGYIGINKANQMAPFLKVTMTDRDVVERACEISGAGVVWPHRRKQQPHHKDQFTWYVGSKYETYAVLMALWPWLGQRRRARLKEAVAAFRNGPPPAAPWRHGTVYAWRRYCKCDECSAAAKAYYSRAFKEPTGRPTGRPPKKAV